MPHYFVKYISVTVLRQSPIVTTLQDQKHNRKTGTAKRRLAVTSGGSVGEYDRLSQPSWLFGAL